MGVIYRTDDAALNLKDKYGRLCGFVVRTGKTHSGREGYSIQATRDGKAYQSLKTSVFETAEERDRKVAKAIVSTLKALKKRWGA